ncbi:hypothetical protein [Lactiplantibacillus plantarum]|uniref:hypothetical protein n=1 Tax=Lactiplantibacillus plantarum TaxID=1590 RepID=UPI000A906F5E|nr:hypothetical protein [Lactiplantibacillus plantarum]
MKMFNKKRRDKNEDYRNHSERATATSTVAAQKPKPKATQSSTTPNVRSSAGVRPTSSSVTASTSAPVKGQNRVNQRRATQTAAKNSVAIEREMADLNKQYQTLRGELKVQLVQDRKHEKQQYETLVAEQLNLEQQLKDAKVTLSKQDKVVNTNDSERQGMVKTINAAQKRYDDAKKALAKSDQTIKSLEKKITQSEQSLADLKQNEADMRKAIQGEQDLKKLFVLMKQQEKQAQDLYQKSDAINSELVKLQKRETPEA